MVSNVTVFDLTLDGVEFGKKDTIYIHSAAKLNKLVETLSTAFYEHFKDKFPRNDLEYYRKKFTHALINQRNALILQSDESNERRWITSEDTAFINHLPMFSQKPCKRCVNYTYRTVRINPYGDLAKRTLGLNIGDRQYGMEYYFNEQLAGVEGSRKYLYVNKARLPLNEYVEPVDGCDIHTTLNLEIQNMKGHIDRSLDPLAGATLQMAGGQDSGQRAAAAPRQAVRHAGCLCGLKAEGRECGNLWLRGRTAVEALWGRSALGRGSTRPSTVCCPPL